MSQKQFDSSKPHTDIDDIDIRSSSIQRPLSEDTFVEQLYGNLAVKDKTEEFTQTLVSRVDRFQKTRKLLSRLALLKLEAKNKTHLAELIGFTSKVHGKLLDDAIMIATLCQANTDVQPLNLPLIKQSVSTEILMKWLFSKTEIDQIVLYLLYANQESYHSIAEELAILDENEVIRIHSAHLVSFFKDISKLS
jgi:hypothetical protein